MFIIFFIVVIVIEMPSVNLASFRVQKDQSSDHYVTYSLNIEPPDTINSNIIKIQKPILCGIGSSSNKSCHLPGSLQSEQTLFKETVPGPTSDLLGHPTSKSAIADTDLVQDKIFQKNLSAIVASVNVSERVATSQMLLVNQKQAPQITVKYGTKSPRITSSTMRLPNTMELNMRSTYKTSLSRTGTNHNMVSENIWSLGELSSTIQHENVMFQHGASQSSTLPDVASVSSSVTRDMKKSQGSLQNPSQGSSVKIIDKSKTMHSDARRFPMKVNLHLMQVAHTMSTYPFYPNGVTPSTDAPPTPSLMCGIGKCYLLKWTDPFDPNKDDDPERLRNTMKKVQQYQKFNNFRLKTTAPTTTTEDDSIFPEQYI